MLLNWIPKTPCPIPGNASHIARVGAIVLNDKREVHLCKEQFTRTYEVNKYNNLHVHTYLPNVVKSWVCGR